MLLQQAAQYTVVTIGRVDQQTSQVMKPGLPRVRLKQVPVHSMPAKDLCLVRRARTLLTLQLGKAVPK